VNSCAGDLPGTFEGRIGAIDVAVMLAWGALAAEAESRGRTIPAMDSLISALALHHDLVLATRDEDDFRPSGVRLLNPWNRG
jgi:predicted nucleic acid-binding protein